MRSFSSLRHEQPQKRSARHFLSTTFCFEFDIGPFTPLNAKWPIPRTLLIQLAAHTLKYTRSVITAMKYIVDAGVRSDASKHAVLFCLSVLSAVLPSTSAVAVSNDNGFVEIRVRELSRTEPFRAAVRGWFYAWFVDVLQCSHIGIKRWFKKARISPCPES